MKIFTAIFLILFVMFKTQAQDYQISFTGTGAATSVDSVKVENLTQGTSKKLSGSDILYLTSTVGINELKPIDYNALQIFPNPMNGTCLFDFEATADGKLTVELYNLSGKRILQEQESVSKGHQTYYLSGIGSGIYMLKVESSNYSYASKIVSINGTNGKAELKHIAATSGVNEKNTSSNTGNLKSLNSENSVINMQYNTDDQLKMTGKSGIYSLAILLVPSQSQNVPFDFVACTDANNNNYAAVKIGTQIWMVENLKTTKYRNGDTIQNITDNTKWLNLVYTQIGALCNYNNNAANGNKYGKLYNYNAVGDNRKIAPAGWHVPSDDEWTKLKGFITLNFGTSHSEAKALAAKTDWNSSPLALLWSVGNDLTINNSSGFTALPGGDRSLSGAFYHMGESGSWWSSTGITSLDALGQSIGYIDIDVPYRSTFRREFGYSVRCVKD